jgi:hypothetical protein
MTPTDQTAIEKRPATMERSMLVTDGCHQDEQGSPLPAIPEDRLSTPVMRPRHLAWMLFGALAGCGGSSSTCVPAGTSVAVSHTNATGACPAAVVAGVTALNGSEKFTPKKDLSCGVVHFKQNINFSAQDANQASCMGSDAIAFNDFRADGGSGTDTMDITCTDNTTCTETFDVTFTPQ